VLAALCSAGALSTGRLFTQLSGDTGDRRDFEHLITGLARAGLIELEEASFEKDGKRIDFRRARPTARATALNPGAPLDLALTGQIVRSAALTKPKGKRRRAKAGAAELPAPAPPARRTRKRSPDAGGLEEALRNWRRDEARRQNVPAFRILSDRTLKELAEEIPTSESSLLAVHGIGKSKADKYGKQLLQILRKDAH
jgi:superfamily II DNA helicase RecQ